MGCALGIENIGYVMICYGITDAICSLSFGRLVQFVGHIPFFALGRIIFSYICFRSFEHLLTFDLTVAMNVTICTCIKVCIC